MSKISINCPSCLADRHDDCSDPETCLCAVETEHNTKKTIKIQTENEIVKEQPKQVQRRRSNKKNHMLHEYYNIVDEIFENDFFITLRDSKKIWYYDKEESIYVPHGESYIEQLIDELTNEPEIKTRNEVIAIIKSRTYVDTKEFFNSKYITTLDGVLDPDTFENLGHAPDLYSRKKLPFNIESEAKNFKLWQHILTIIDPKDINILMELIWICISKKNPFKKLFVFMGLTNSQKSTLAEILTWIVGEENVSFVKPQKFLSKSSRFDTAQFIDKSMNISTEIGNLTENEIETLKGLVGAEIQTAERKNDNTAYTFDPNKFVFLFTTNKLGGVYANIDDNSLITRFQFMIFRNIIDDSKTDGLWYADFFTDDKDRQSAIDTVVKFVLAYKKSQVFGSTPKTKWSTITETKSILRQEMPLEDKYFADERMIKFPRSKLTLDEIRNDFEKFVGYELKNRDMGVILKKNGYNTKQSNSKTILEGYSFKDVNNDKFQLSLN